MKKSLLVAVILVAALAFLALPDSQAGAAKPIKWKATVTGTNLWGSGEFVGGHNSVNIYNGVGTCALTGNPYSYIELQLFQPSLQFYMSGFSGDDVVPSPYGFPGISTPWPLCIGDFLNGRLQPTADYPHIILRFSTCGCNSTAADLMAMQNGDILPVCMALSCFSHIWGCPPNSPYTQETFLNLNMISHGYLKAGANLPDVYIQRIGDVWTAYVNTAFDNPAYQTPLDDYTSAEWPGKLSDNLLGQYATCSSSTNKKGKTIWTTTYHYPTAKAPLNFQIAFTKY